MVSEGIAFAGFRTFSCPPVLLLEEESGRGENSVLVGRPMRVVHSWEAGCCWMPLQENIGKGWEGGQRVWEECGNLLRGRDNR